MWTKSETCPKYEWPYIIFDDLVLTITVKVVWFCYNNYHMWMFRWHYIYWELISIESECLWRVNVYGEWMSMESECQLRVMSIESYVYWEFMSIESSCLLISYSVIFWWEWYGSDLRVIQMLYTGVIYRYLYNVLVLSCT